MSYIPSAAFSDVSRSTVRPAGGTATVALPLAGILAGTFRPEFYGAKFDGSTDDTTPWANMFADIKAKGYGDVRMPAGQTVVRPGALNIPSQTTLRGGGQNVSQFLRYSGQTGTLLKMNGTATAVGAVPGAQTHCVNSVLADFGILGGGVAGVLLQAIYSSHHIVSNVLFNSTQDAGLQCVELWDSVFDDCLWDNCGMNPSASAYTTNTRLGSEAIQILGGIAATGSFGASADSNNQLAFTRCRMETFGAGAIAVQKYLGTNPGGSNYALRFSDLKIESGVLSGINFVSMSDDTQTVAIERSYLSINGATGTNAGAIDMIYLGGSFGNQLRYITLNIGAANTVQSCIRHYGNPGSKVEDVFVNGSSCSQAILYIPGGSQVPYRNVLYVNGQAGAIVGPTSYAAYS